MPRNQARNGIPPWPRDDQARHESRGLGGTPLRAGWLDVRPGMPPRALSYHATDTPSARDLQTVDAGLDQHNFTVAPLSDVQQLAAFASDESGQLIGGAAGRTWGSCCELLQLWVAAEHRSLGVGSRLLAEFEAHARKRDCRIFYLTTLSFQAPEFYKRHGYEVLAQIQGYPNGIVKYLMHKADA